MNHKASYVIGKEVLFMLFFGFIVACLFLGLGITTSVYKNNLIETPSYLQSELIALRFTSIPECFAWVDKVNEVHAGIIDLDKFNTQVLNKCYLTEQERGFKTFNFRLKLSNSGQEIDTNNYFNKDATDLTLTKEVLVKKPNKDGLEKDLLFIYVQERIGT